MELWRMLLWTWMFYWCLISAGSEQLQQQCEQLKSLMDTRKLHYISKSNEPKGSVSGGRCGKFGHTCCTSHMEEVLLVDGRKQLSTAVSSDVNQLHSLLLNRYRRFNDFFTTLLLESKRDFDQMFKTTYGTVYEENSYVFTDLFAKLEHYYENGQVDLEEAMENFFSTLYQKMFTVINAQYQFDEKYLACVRDDMKDLKPFGDVPRKLSVQIKRAFVATRTFAQALNIAKDIVMGMQALNSKVVGDCPQAVLRMSYCPLCQGLSKIEPCADYCLNVMRGCLAYHTELNTEWNNYLDAIDKLIARLLGPFNIQNVVEPIDIKISEAIMNFQENAHEVSEKIFTGCGRPVLNRRGRDTREIELQSYKFNNVETNGSLPPILNKLIKDIRVKLKETRHFWNNIPFRICNAQYNFTNENTSSCWNGTHVGRYLLSPVGSGLNAQASNREVSVDISRSSSVLNEQIDRLKKLTRKLYDAFHGHDVKWIDHGSISMYESSGDGSGDKIFDDDDEDLVPSGGHIASGHRPKGPQDQEEGDDDQDDDDDEDGGGGGGHDHDDPVDGSTPKQPPTTHHGTTRNNESNVIPNVRGDDVRMRGSGETSGAPKRAQMSLFRVVIGYMFPIWVMWFGGFFADWL